MNATIQFTCPHCSHQIQLPSSTVGMQGKCPGCGQVVTITAGAAQMPPVNPAAQNQPVLVNPVDSPPTIPSSAPVVNPPEQVNSGDSPLAKLGQVVTGLQQHSRRTQGKKVNGWVIGGVIFGGMFLLSLIFSLSQMGNISNLRSDTSSSQSQSSSADNGLVKNGTLSSFEDHPPPVLQAVRNGNEVFELMRWMLEAGDGFKQHNMYLIFRGDELITTGSKFTFRNRGSAEFFGHKEDDIAWDYGTGGDSKVKTTFRKISETEYMYLWTMEIKTSITITEVSFEAKIVMDPEFGEGYWKCTETTVTDYRGRMADMEDTKEVESFRGAVIPVKSP